VRSDVVKEKLLGWYPLDQRVEGRFAIAIAQRSNAAYSERLLSANAKVWLAVTVAWTVVAVSISLVVGLSLSTFLLGVALPLLPALLDVWDQWRVTKRAGEVRRAMAEGIERFVRGDGEHELSGEDLLAWQGQLYDLRRNAPQVPNLVYRRARKRNERIMNTVAAELAAVAIQRQSGG
jgi:hypothetical protein